MKLTSLSAAIVSAIAIAPDGDVDVTLMNPWPRVFAAAEGGDIRIASVMKLRPLNAVGSQYELMIYGDIGESWYGSSVAAADVVKQLNELPPTVQQINVRINSYGGSVSDGLAIYNALNRMAAIKAVTIDGVAMSIASLIAMVGDTVEMPEASLLMIHAPWGMCAGNSNDMREFADFLDVYAEAMAGAYTAKSGQSRDAIMALLTDGKDHTFTAAQALEQGFCDKLLSASDDEQGDESGATATTDDDSETEETDTLAFLSGMQRFTARQPSMLGAIRAALKHSKLTASAAGANACAQPAASAASASGDIDMLRKFKGRLVSLAPQTDPTVTRGPGNGGGGDDAAAIAAKARADLDHRNKEIVARLKAHLGNPQIAALQTEALSDLSMTLDQVNAKALEILAAKATPNPADPGRVEAGADQRDKTRAQATNFLLVRAGGQGMKPEEIVAARQGNPFNGMTMLDIARACCIRAGLNPEGWSKDRIVASAITHSDSDFPHIFENVMHKLLLNSYLSVEQTWKAFCRTSTLADFRAHNRYYMGGFSDLLPVDQTGEYQDGTFSDAEKETITGQSKGRILNLSREMILNDDMGVFTTAAQKLGQAAGRTLEKDVYAVLTSNPTLTDGIALFHASHNNLAASGAVVGSQTFDDVRVGMGSQLDPSGNDFVGTQPAVLLVPLKYKGDADVVNGSRYNVDVASKFEIPNKSYGMFRQIVGTPRLTGTAWYAFADPNLEPVIEVGFVEGIQEPQVQSEESFRSNGIAWRVIFDYGVAAVGFRGGWKNPGA